MICISENNGSGPHPVILLPDNKMSGNNDCVGIWLVGGVLRFLQRDILYNYKGHYSKRVLVYAERWLLNSKYVWWWYLKHSCWVSVPGGELDFLPCWMDHYCQITLCISWTYLQHCPEHTYNINILNMFSTRYLMLWTWWDIFKTFPYICHHCQNIFKHSRSPFIP
jgi:hypothetical protein